MRKAVDRLQRQASDRRLAVCAASLLAVLTWMISHAYAGLEHDARLYTLQALAWVGPDSLGNDVFLRHGSQDRFTVFSPLYAAAIGLFGVEPAAAMLTLALQIALCTAAYLLARALMPARLALLGLSLLIAIPGDYGAARVFACMEPFLTPRMGAEALVLLGLAAAERGRPAGAIALVGLAAALHPVMAAAGVVALLLLQVLKAGPARGAAICATIVTATLAGLAVMAFWMPPGATGRFDAGWWQLVAARNPNLLLGFWQWGDWARTAVTLATLLVGARGLPSAAARRLAAAAATCGVAGLMLTWLACDRWHLVLLTQLQPWRWLWLATVVAALVLAPIVRSCWQAGGIARVAALLLPSAWVFGDVALAFVPLAIQGVLLAASPLRTWSTSEARLLACGGGAVLALALLWRAASNLEFTAVYFLDPTWPLWFRRLVSGCHDGCLPAAAMTLAWWLGNHAGKHRRALFALAALSMSGCAVVFAPAWHAWSGREFSAQRYADFAPMRAVIPPGTDVFWPENPFDSWMLLQRPNYLSGFQTAGVLFSRSAAYEMSERAERLAAIIPPPTFLSWNSGAKGLLLSAERLRQACQSVAYLVTQIDIGLVPLAIVAPPPGSSGRNPTRLYRCRALPP